MSSKIIVEENSLNSNNSEDKRICLECKNNILGDNVDQQLKKYECSSENFCLKCFGKFNTLRQILALVSNVPDKSPVEQAQTIKSLINPDEIIQKTPEWKEKKEEMNNNIDLILKFLENDES
jgi:hypothetical protein